jgi:hypothetical protein
MDMTDRQPGKITSQNHRKKLWPISAMNSSILPPIDETLQGATVRKACLLGQVLLVLTHSSQFAGIIMRPQRINTLQDRTASLLLNVPREASLADAHFLGKFS